MLINQCLIPVLLKQCMPNHTNQFSQQGHRGCCTELLALHKMTTVSTQVHTDSKVVRLQRH